MPIGKKSAADSTLYALIAFVALFIIAATAGVIYYLKFEEQRGLADTAQKRLGEFASPAEVQKIGALVGAEQSGKSRLKVTLDYLDQTLSLIVPGFPGDTSAEVKVNEATRKVREMLAGIDKQYSELNDVDANTTLLQVTEKLTAVLQSASAAEKDARGQLAELQNKFDDATKASMEKEQALLAEKDKFQQQFEKVRAGYDELKALL